MKVKVESKDGGLVVMTSQDGINWQGGAPLTLQEMLEVGGFMVNYAGIAKSIISMAKGEGYE
ncbi:MAG: hypothetical protein ABJG42_24650 [Vibrio splendidus]